MKEIKAMKNFPGENGNLSDSSIFKARLREADLASQEKLQEIQGAADELARQAIIDKLKQAEVEYEKLKLEFEQEAYDGIEGILSHVELSAAENEDNFTSGIDGLLAKLFKFFNFMDSELGVETDPQVYRVIRKREEAEKEAWIAEVIKFLRDKFNKLIKAIFSRDLSFQQKIDKEIKELYERLFGGSLSPEEEAAILERLEALRDLKLKLQIFVVGSVIAMFAELFSVELTASVETTKEEGKEKAPAKEATKEVRENLEVKVDAKEKPQLKYDVIPALDAESWLKKPITLTKQEFDILRDPIKKMVELPPKPAINNENSGVPKPEVKERQENENKKLTQSAQKPNIGAPPKKAPGKVSGASGVTFSFINAEGINFTERAATFANKCSTANNFNGKGSKSANEPELDDLYVELAKETAGWNAQREKSAAGIKHDYPIDHFQAPAETNGKSHAGAKNEPQQSSVDNAQPTGECSSVKINNHVESIGKAPEEASRGI